MSKDKNSGEGGTSEPVKHRGPSAEQKVRRMNETVIVNQYLHRQIQQMELMLLQATDLFSLFEILLISLPKHFELKAAELWLHDPEDSLLEILSGVNRYGQHLQLHDDVFVLQEMYDLDPDIIRLDAADPRMFEILKTDDGINDCVMMPLLDGGRIIGSFHVGAPSFAFEVGPSEEDMIAHLATVIALCLKSAITRHQVNQLTLLDPLTHISNPRGFEANLSREISRAQRVDEPVSILMMEIDEFDDLLKYYGEVRSNFVLKKVAERVSSDLRATDCMARFSASKMTALLPGCSEHKSVDIAQRMRRDIDGFAIDDGRGAILHVTLSLGVVTWEPSMFPAIEMNKLQVQMQSAAEKGLRKAASEGNCVEIWRLGAPSV